MTLTFISHNSCPQETHPLRNWMKSSWTFSKSASFQLPREAHIPPTSSARSEAFKRGAVEGNPPWEWFLSLNPTRGGRGGKGGTGESLSWRKLDTALESRLSATTRMPPPSLPPGSSSIRGVLPFAPSAAADTRIPSSRELGSRRALVPSAGLD